MNLFRLRRHGSWNELASAYVDGSIDPAREADFARHLDSCGRCQETVRDMEGLRMSLRELPDEALPRSFRLTPAMLIEDEPRRAVTPGRVTKSLAWGSKATAGLAAAALAVVLVVDLGGNSSGGGDNDIAAGDAGADASAPLLESNELEDESRNSAESTAAATGTAASAPPYDGGGEVEGSSAGGAGAPTPEAADEEQAPETPVESDTVTQDSVAQPDTQFQTVAIEQADADSNNGLVRGLEIGLAGILAASIGAAVFLSRRRRHRV